MGDDPGRFCDRGNRRSAGSVLLRVKEREYRTGIAMAPFFELGMVLHFLRN